MSPTVKPVSPKTGFLRYFDPCRWRGHRSDARRRRLDFSTFDEAIHAEVVDTEEVGRFPAQNMRVTLSRLRGNPRVAFPYYRECDPALDPTFGAIRVASIRQKRVLSSCAM